MYPLTNIFLCINQEENLLKSLEHDLLLKAMDLNYYLILYQNYIIKIIY